MNLLKELHEDRLDYFQKHPESVTRMLEVGETPTDASMDGAQLAAMADVCHAIFNLSETLTRK